MESAEEELNYNLEECLTMAELQSNDLEELLKELKLKTSYYQEETAKMEAVFLKLQLMNEQLKMSKRCEELTEKLHQLQEQFNLRELTPNAVALSHADKLRKHNNYAAKMKICIKMYIELNEALMRKIKHLRMNYEQAEKKVEQIVTVTEDEVKGIEKKISRYEHELNKLEKKYPWLKNNDYSLPSISKEINLLIAARREKEELVKELSCYHGLKPDLQEASEQLNHVKSEYEQLNGKLLEK